MFGEYTSPKHQNISFTVEHENICSLSFLDVKVCLKNGKIITSVYRKPTFSGVFTNYENFIPTYQRRGLSHTFFTGGLTYVAISRHFIHKSIIWRLCSGKTIILRISLIHALSYFLINCIHLHHSWEVLRFKFEKKPQKLFTDNLTSFNLKIVFKSPVRVKSFFLLRQ